MMVVPVTLKHLFGLASIAWILVWLGALVTIGGLMGDSIQILSVFLGIALIPPSLLYFLLFHVMPRIVKRFKRPATQL
jgi:hypothetical protein